VIDADADAAVADVVVDTADIPETSYIGTISVAASGVPEPEAALVSCGFFSQGKSLLHLSAFAGGRALAVLRPGVPAPNRADGAAALYSAGVRRVVVRC
jgi:hypothetical protein